MIRTPEADAPPFPFSGSPAYIGGTAEKVKIISTSGDSALIQRVEGLTRSDGASRNRREPLANLYATAHDAKFHQHGASKRLRKPRPAQPDGVPA